MLRSSSSCSSIQGPSPSCCCHPVSTWMGDRLGRPSAVLCPIVGVDHKRKHCVCQIESSWVCFAAISNMSIVVFLQFSLESVCCATSWQLAGSMVFTHIALGLAYCHALPTFAAKAISSDANGAIKQCLDQLDLKNLGISVGLVLLSCVQAVIYAISYILPVQGRHLWFFTNPWHRPVLTFVPLCCSMQKICGFR